MPFKDGHTFLDTRHHLIVMTSRWASALVTRTIGGMTQRTLPTMRPSAGLTGVR